MAHVYLPVQMRELAGHLQQVSVSGRTVREVIDNLEEKYPGTRERLCQANQLRTGLCVSINGSVSSLALLAPVGEEDEVHFLPAIGGG